MDEGFADFIQLELTAQGSGNADLALGGDGNKVSHTLNLSSYIIWLYCCKVDWGNYN